MRCRDEFNLQIVIIQLRSLLHQKTSPNAITTEFQDQYRQINTENFNN